MKFVGATLLHFSDKGWASISLIVPSVGTTIAPLVCMAHNFVSGHGTSRSLFRTTLASCRLIDETHALLVRMTVQCHNCRVDSNVATRRSNVGNMDGCVAITLLLRIWLFTSLGHQSHASLEFPAPMASMISATTSSKEPYVCHNEHAKVRYHDGLQLQLWIHSIESLLRHRESALITYICILKVRSQLSQLCSRLVVDKTEFAQCIVVEFLVHAVALEIYLDMIE